MQEAEQDLSCDGMRPPKPVDRLKKKKVSFIDGKEFISEKRSGSIALFDENDEVAAESGTKLIKRLSPFGPYAEAINLMTPCRAYMGFSPVSSTRCAINEFSRPFDFLEKRRKEHSRNKKNYVKMLSASRKREVLAKNAEDDGCIEKHAAECSESTGISSDIRDSVEEASKNSEEHGSMSTSPSRSASFSHWKVGSRYIIKRKLGHGSYGEVAEGFDQTMKRPVAIKRIVNIFEQVLDAKRLYREIFILRNLNNNQVIKLLDIIVSDDFECFSELYLVLEFVDTDLHKLIMSPQFLTNEHIQTLLYQMLVGLKHLHRGHVIHRDLKPANILLNEDCTLKICDFGLSRVVGPEHISRGCRCPKHDPCDESNTSSESVTHMKHRPECDLAHGFIQEGLVASELALPASLGKEKNLSLSRQLTKHVVTRWYRAPELILLQDYTSAVDVWSIGCIFAELLSMQAESVPNHKDRMPLFPGKSCFPLSIDNPATETDRLDQLNVIFSVIGTPSEDDLNESGIVRKYIKKLQWKEPQRLSDIFPGAQSDALNLLEKMLSFNASKRITVAQALEHQYLTSIRNLELEKITMKAVPIDVESVQLSKDDIKRAIYEEVQHYR